MDDFRFRFNVFWSAEDHEFVGRCLEFPSLSWLAPSAGEALTGISRLVADTIEDMKHTEETVPGAVPRVLKRA